MKKFLSVLVALTMIFTLSMTAFAAAEGNPNLSDLATEIITVSTVDDETIYSNIQDFYVAARAEFPSVQDIDLAKAVMERTGQDYTNMSDELILENLDFTEITSTEAVYHLLENGTVEILTPAEAAQIIDNPAAPMAEWTSEDGYLKLTTFANAGSKISNETPYTLSCTATWLKFPVWRLTDTLAIVYGGAFDDDYTITSTFNETGKCSYCGRTLSWSGTESYGKDGTSSAHFIKTSDLIELDFAQSQAIGTKLDLKAVSCMHPVDQTAANFAQTTKITGYIRFRVLCDSTTEARAAYAHTKLAGSVTISGSVSSSGVSPTFGGALDIIAAKYCAAPLTLRHN